MKSISKSFVVFLASIIAIGPFSIDTFLPAIPVMAETFNVPINSAELLISTFLVGFAFGQILGGPLSDRLGRKPVAIIGLLLLLVTSLLVALSESITVGLIMRFVQGFGGGFTVVLAAAIVRDKFQGYQIARTLSLIGMIMLVAPIIAPAFGTAILLYFDWQGIFYSLAIYAFIFTAFGYLLSGRNTSEKYCTSFCFQGGQELCSCHKE